MTEELYREDTELEINSNKVRGKQTRHNFWWKVGILKCLVLKSADIYV